MVNGDVCVDGVNVSEVEPEGISNVGVDAAPLTGTRTVTVKPGSVFAYVLSYVLDAQKSLSPFAPGVIVMVTVSPGAPDIVLKATVELGAANAATGFRVARAVVTRTPPRARAMRFLVMCGFLLS
jgi:hypothetical protein